MNAAKSPMTRLAMFALVAVALPLAAAEIAIEDGATDPLAGRDYTMRVDVAAARVERYDAATGRVEGADLARGRADALVPGLWLAVPQPGSDAVALLPVGTNPAVAAASIDALDLPPALVARLRADGGVIYVDAGASDVGLAAANGAR